MDNELFELCKEVHSRFPEWGDKIQVWWHKGSDINGGNYVSHYGRADYEKKLVICPDYSSDFILEVLPKSSCVIKRSQHYNARLYGDTDTSLSKYSDTPIKALLKLTIALSDTGELEKKN